MPPTLGDLAWIMIKVVLVIGSIDLVLALLLWRIDRLKKNMARRAEEKAKKKSVDHMINTVNKTRSLAYAQQDIRRDEIWFHKWDRGDYYSDLN